MVEIEPFTRFKDSLLWKLQHAAYEQFGLQAWAKEGVPFYLTSNPLLARQFSHVILGYLRDILSEIDRKEPMYIFDLGAGSGRLGYLILNFLLPMVRDILGSDLKICYVMTDMVKSNLEGLQSHPRLQRFIESKHLDFALYHNEQTSPLRLEVSGDLLDFGRVVNPIALISTYYFDTVPQDYFRIKNGHLEEGRAALHLPDEYQGADVSQPDPEWIMKLDVRYSYVPVESLESVYPEEKEYRELLKYYVDSFKEACFLFPSGGLKTLGYFSRVSNGRYLLMAADQGAATKEQVLDWAEPKISRHASFSMPVSYHLLAHYFSLFGGHAFLTSFPQPKFVVMAAVLGCQPNNAKLAFEEQMDFFEPVEYWKLTDLHAECLESISLEQLLVLIKLGNWDPVNFHFFYPYFVKKIGDASQSERDFLAETIERVWKHFFPVSVEEASFVQNLGMLLKELGYADRAEFFFDEARNLLHPRDLGAKP